MAFAEVCVLLEVYNSRSPIPAQAWYSRHTPNAILDSPSIHILLLAAYHIQVQ